MSSSIIAFADNTTADYYYYNANGSGSSGQVWRGTNSADVLGYILAVISRNQQELYSLMSNMSSGGSDLSTVNLNTTNIVKLLDGTANGIYTMISQVTNTKLDLIAEGIGAGSSLDNLQTKLSGVLSGINRLEAKLSYWDNSHGRSYTISDMQFNIMNDVEELNSLVDDVKTILINEQVLSNARNTILTSEQAISIARNEILTSEMALSVERNSILEQFNDDYNDINWIDTNRAVNVKSSLNGEYLSAPYTGKQMYICFMPINGTNIYKIRVPIVIYNGGNGTDIDIDFYSYNASGSSFNINDFIITYNFTSQYLDLVFSMPEQFYYGSRDFVIGMSVPSTAPNFRYTTANFKGLWYLDSDKRDYYDVFDNLIGRNILDLLNQAKFMFFDDESIQAKKNEASKTTEVINDFTGQGGASASASDFGNAKEAVSSVKSGLNTNVSVSNLFSIFDNSSGYSFWSNETRNELNSNSNRRGRNSSTPMYDNALEQIYNAMGVKYD